MQIGQMVAIVSVLIFALVALIRLSHTPRSGGCGEYVVRFLYFLAAYFLAVAEGADSFLITYREIKREQARKRIRAAQNWIEAGQEPGAESAVDSMLDVEGWRLGE